MKHRKKFEKAWHYHWIQINNKLGLHWIRILSYKKVKSYTLFAGDPSFSSCKSSHGCVACKKCCKMLDLVATKFEILKFNNKLSGVLECFLQDRETKTKDVFNWR